DSALARLAENELTFAELEGARQQAARLTAELSALAREHDQIKESLDAAQREKSDAADKLGQLTTQLTSAASANEAEKNRALELEATVVETCKALEAAQQECAALEEQLREGEARLKTLGEKQADYSK